MFLLSHCTACFYYFTARLSDFDEETWVARYEIIDYGVFMKYITALYWSIQTLTTVGYGNYYSYMN